MAFFLFQSRQWRHFLIFRKLQNFMPIWVTQDQMWTEQNKQETVKTGHPIVSVICQLSSVISLFQPIPAYSSLFKHIPAYSRLLQNIPAYSSIFQFFPAYSIIFQPDLQKFRIIPTPAFAWGEKSQKSAWIKIVTNPRKSMF